MILRKVSLLRKNNFWNNFELYKIPSCRFLYLVLEKMLLKSTIPSLYGSKPSLKENKRELNAIFLKNYA